MSEGFSNPVVGGNAILIRPGIQSPNFVAGSSGWIIRADGTAEFNSVVFRGNAVFPDNQLSVVKGVFWDGNPNAITHPFIGATTVGAVAEFIVAGTDDGNGAQSGLEVWSDQTTVGSSRLILGGGASGVVSGDIQWGANPHMPGGQYMEQLGISANVTITSGVVKTIIFDTPNAGMPIWGIYPAAYNTTTGIWTSPKDGLYEFSVRLKGAAFTAAATRSLCRLLDQTSVLEFACDEKPMSLGTIPGHTLSAMAFMPVGRQMRVDYFQNSGANQVINTAEATGLIIKRIL